MACVDIQVDYYLDEASDSALLDELRCRRAKPQWKPAAEDDPNGTHAWTRRGMADDIRQAYYARNTNRLEVILAQLELREVA